MRLPDEEFPGREIDQLVTYGSSDESDITNTFGPSSAPSIENDLVAQIVREESKHEEIKRSSARYSQAPKLQPQLIGRASIQPPSESDGSTERHSTRSNENKPDICSGTQDAKPIILKDMRESMLIGKSDSAVASVTLDDFNLFM